MSIATMAAIALRARITYHGSIWADEGSFLNVLGAPSWRDMVAFLKLHESHPPLFYLLMLAWSRLIGGGDIALMILPILLGAAVVPAMFVAGRELFSSKVGLIAACIAAFAPQLTEHSSQLRPYGLLSLSALTSVAALAVCMSAPTRRTWLLFVVSTAVMLYTHNWAWMIVAGEFGAIAVGIIGQSANVRRVFVKNAAAAWIVVFALYAPWLPSLLYQSTHAGHGRLALEGALDYVGYFLFSLNTILESLITGRVAEKHTVAICELVVAMAALGWVSFRYSKRDVGGHQPQATQRLKFIVRTSVFALVAALVVSPFNNVILPRGVATVMPMLILASACWIDDIISRRASRVQSQLAAVVFSVVFVVGACDTAGLLKRPRSNVSLISQAVRLNMQPSDLLIVAPEWFAGSFDHYFPASIEQIDYPYEGRSGMIAFSNIWDLRSQSTAVEKLQKKIYEATNHHRRIWFVFERRYLRTFSQDEIDKAYRYHLPGPFTVLDVKRIRATLDGLYGGPQKVFEAKDPKPINDELLAYLYAR